MFFFFKQKTAYEMRISDGVQTCALPISNTFPTFLSQYNPQTRISDRLGNYAISRKLIMSAIVAPVASPHILHKSFEVIETSVASRSEERRVGKECVSTCRSRWSPYH